MMKEDLCRGRTCFWESRVAMCCHQHKQE